MIKKKFGKRAMIRHFLLLAGLTLAFVTVRVEPAQACCHCNVDILLGIDEPQWFDAGSGTVDVVNNHLDSEFNAQQTWMISVLFEDNILPAMMLMTEQLTVVAMSQVQIFGSFLDAKHQMETQRIFQKLQAEAHKDYHPSIGMCEFGSATKSLAASERKGEIAGLTMNQRSLDRQLGSPNQSATYGVSQDKESRIAQFKNRFCDPWDQNSGLWQMCRDRTIDPASPPHSVATPVPHIIVPGPAPAESVHRQNYNKDIDYVSLIDNPLTIDADFTNTDETIDEGNIFALASNLYAHDVFYRPDAAELASPPDGRIGRDMTEMQKAYMDSRALIAKRSVAENSFNAIVGMKSEGTAGASEYLEGLLVDLGVVTPTSAAPAAARLEARRLIGSNPSYFAQMEVLTKKVYQNPKFYSNLYDKPANVMRKGVALQAIGLMQKFDMLKSQLRSEASMSVLLELAVVKLQNRIENQTNLNDGTNLAVPAE